MSFNSSLENLFKKFEKATPVYLKWPEKRANRVLCFQTKFYMCCFNLEVKEILKTTTQK